MKGHLMLEVFGERLSDLQGSVDEVGEKLQLIPEILLAGATSGGLCQTSGWVKDQVIDASDQVQDVPRSLA